MEYVSRALEAVQGWREPAPSHPALQVDAERFEAAWSEFAERMGTNYPFHHPRYAGQMLKPPHPVAIAAYTAALHANTNNHALDGGPATSAMEVEVVAWLAEMFGLQGGMGHLTSSGTIANLEALWVGRELHPGKAVVYGANAHYTHSRMCAVLGVRGIEAPADVAGRIDLDAVEELCRAGDVGTVVVTAGTTGTGTLDDVARAVSFRETYGVRVHVDAAYGGFFTLLGGLRADRRRALQGDRRRGQRRRRPAQARAAAVRVRRDPVPRPGRRPAVQARLALHVLHLRRAAPGRDLARVLAGGRRGGRAVADAPVAGPGADPGRGRAGRAGLGGADPRLGRAHAPPRARARHPHLLPDAARRLRDRRGFAGRVGAGDERGRPGVPVDAPHRPRGVRRRPPDVEMDADGARVLRSVLMKPEHEPHVPWLHRARQSNRETVREKRPVKAVPLMLRTSVPGPAEEPTTTGLEPATSTASKRV